MAAERDFEFSKCPLNQPPPGFRSTVSGLGAPGDWRIILDEVPPALPALTDKAPIVTRRHVLGQLAKDATDEHFPLLIFEEETFGDFTFTTLLKAVSGDKEQMAGIAFRIQDEQNYYVVRLSALGNTFKFYKFVNGQRSQPIGPDLEIKTGVWHELTIECRGNRIRCLLDAKEVIPTLTDYSFSQGKIGFWTKSDSVSYFADARMKYTPREPLAQVLVREQLKKYSRLVGLKIYAIAGDSSVPKIVASNDVNEIGKPGGKAVTDAIKNNHMYCSKGKGTVTATLPLHDRNGDSVAAVQVVMKSFLGQTDQNAIVKAMPIVKAMENRFRDLTDLIE